MFIVYFVKIVYVDVNIEFLWVIFKEFGIMINFYVWCFLNLFFFILVCFLNIKNLKKIIFIKNNIYFICFYREILNLLKFVCNIKIVFCI